MIESLASSIIIIKNMYSENKSNNLHMAGFDFLSFCALYAPGFPIRLTKLPSNNRLFLEQLCVKNKVKINPVLETESLGLIADFIAKSTESIGFVTRNFIEKELKRKNIKLLQTDFEITPRNINCYTHMSENMSTSCKKFIGEMISYFKG